MTSKSLQVRSYHDATIKSFLDIVGTMGLDSPDKLTFKHIQHRPGHGCAATFANIEPVIQIAGGNCFDEDNKIGLLIHKDAMRA